MSKRVCALRSIALSLSLALLLPPSGLAAHRVRVPEAPDAPTSYSAYNGHPRLVIVVIIDQFRGDYLERYRADFKGRGFRLFLDHGAYFPDCYYDYANTKTAPGHATLGTGAYTDGHGIAGNEWWDLDRNKDRPVSSVEDDRYLQVGGPGSGTATTAGPPPPAAAATSNAPEASASESPARSGSGSAPAAAVSKSMGASPRNLLASTVGDELRLATKGQSRVYGISLKDRAAILPSGAAANAAFWIDPASGYFVTSSYYASQLPGWATAFNTGGRIEEAYNEAKADAVGALVTLDAASAAAHPARGTGAPAPVSPIAQAPGLAEAAMPYPTGKGFYGIVGSSPAANSYELDFARALIQGEQLGQHATTDLVTVSLSANDIMGHQTGPDSPYQRQMVDGLDADLDGFFGWLDKNIEGGLANVWVALSADHGIAPIPAEAAKLGMPAASIDMTRLDAAINEAINLKFSPGEKVDYLLSHPELPYIALNRPAFERAGVNETEAEEAVQNALPAAVRSLPSGAAPAAAGYPSKPTPSEVRLAPEPILVRSYTRLQLASGEMPRSELGALLAHSYSPNGGWYVMTIFADYQMEALNGIQTTHFSPWSYDRHVPLGFFGAPFQPGIYRGRVAPVDLAATLASLLGINQPSASVGHILTQAFRPASAVTYPKPVVVPVKGRRRHSRHRGRDAASPDSPSAAGNAVGEPGAQLPALQPTPVQAAKGKQRR